MIIPVDFHFRSGEVNIRRDPVSGDVILSEVPSLTEVFATLDAVTLPTEFMSDVDRDRRPPENHTQLDQIFNDSTSGAEKE